MYPTNLWRTFLSPSADLQWKLLSRRLHRGSAISIQSRHSLVKKLLYSIKILNFNFHWIWATVDEHWFTLMTVDEHKQEMMLNDFSNEWLEQLTFPMNDFSIFLLSIGKKCILLFFHWTAFGPILPHCAVEGECGSTK